MKLFVGAGLLVTAGQLLPQPAAAQPFSANPLEVLAAQACQSLNALELPELTAIDAEWLGSEASGNSGIRPESGDTTALPAFCRVRGRVDPSIRFEVWLPLPIDWNGRFLGLGGTDYAGSLDVPELRRALVDGYAVAATDTGHMAGSYGWMTDQERLRDFGYRAIYEMTAKAQAVVAGYFGRPADYRYFNGCSLGGRQGLMEAQRFPDDYDGIVAGAPVNELTATHATQLWSTIVAQPLRTAANGSNRDVLTVVNDAAIAQCDTLDGVRDGVLEDPRRCNFDPAQLQCSAGQSASCLSPSEVSAVQQIHAGPSQGLTALSGNRNAVSLPGFAIGSELDWSFAENVSPSPPTLEYFYRAVFGDALWDWRNFDLAATLGIAETQVDWMLDATAADLSEFRGHGGKLILYQGWNDSFRSPEATIAYYESIEAAQTRQAGSFPAPTQDFVRLFMVPGMAHCSGGIGTDQFDALRAIEDWVERGIAPDRIEAERIVADETVRTRPLCPYPQIARYRGSGNSDRTGSFVCEL